MPSRNDRDRDDGQNRTIERANPCLLDAREVLESGKLDQPHLALVALASREHFVPEKCLLDVLPHLAPHDPLEPLLGRLAAARAAAARGQAPALLEVALHLRDHLASPHVLGSRLRPGGRLSAGAEGGGGGEGSSMELRRRCRHRRCFVVIVARGGSVVVVVVGRRAAYNTRRRLLGSPWRGTRPPPRARRGAPSRRGTPAR